MLLITSDHEFRTLVAKHRPPGARLRCAVPNSAGADSGDALQIWIDLDGGAPKHDRGAISHVYFHSDKDRGSHGLKPGMRVRKPCKAQVLDVLWADAILLRNSSPVTPVSASELHLPAWLLDFHELNLKTLCRKYATELGPRLGYRDASLYPP